MSENSSARTCVIDARQRREHQREPLGDAAGVDAGAVQRGAGLLAHAASSSARRRSDRVDPADRRDDVLARLAGCGSRPRGSASIGRRPRSRRRGRGRRRCRSIAATPIGSCRGARRRPRPSLAREWTQQPTSSRSGWPSTPSMAARPTPPGGPLDHTKRSPGQRPLPFAALNRDQREAPGSRHIRQRRGGNVDVGAVGPVVGALVEREGVRVLLIGSRVRRRATIVDAAADVRQQRPRNDREVEADPRRLVPDVGDGRTDGDEAPQQLAHSQSHEPLGAGSRDEGEHDDDANEHRQQVGELPRQAKEQRFLQHAPDHGECQQCARAPAAEGIDERSPSDREDDQRGQADEQRLLQHPSTEQTCHRRGTERVRQEVGRAADREPRRNEQRTTENTGDDTGNHGLPRHERRRIASAAR